MLIEAEWPDIYCVNQHLTNEKSPYPSVEAAVAPRPQAVATETERLEEAVHARPERDAPRFRVDKRKAIGPDAAELAENPRSRSAKLRVAIRTDVPAGEIDAKSIGMPMVEGF